MGKKSAPHQLAHSGESSGELPTTLDSCLSDLRRAEKTIQHLHRQRHLLETRYNGLLDSLDDGFCIVEVLFDQHNRPEDYRFLKVNNAFEGQTGIENPLGRTMREIAPQHEQYWFDVYGRIAQTGESQRFEQRAESLGRYYDVYAFSVGEPEAAQVAVLFKDIAARKRREELQAYLLQLNDTLRPLSDPVRIQEAVTGLAMDYFGADRCYYCEIEDDNAIIRRDAFRSDLPSVANVYPLSSFPILTAVIRAGRPFTVSDARTTPLLDEELRNRCVELQVISFVDVPIIKKGNPCGVLCLTCCAPREWKGEEIDLAQQTAERTWMAVEQAKAAEALRESEDNYRVIVNQSIAGILKMDLRGNIIFTNGQFCRMLDYDSSELLTLEINDIIHSADRERNRLSFRELVVEGKPYEIEKRLVRKSGAEIWVSNHVSPIFDQNGVVMAATIVSIDITRQKELERQKDEFIGVASHELKTPITGIKAYSELLAGMMDNSVPPTIIQLVTRMNVQVNRLTKLIDSLLNTSRIAGGQLMLQLEPLDLNALLEERVHQGQLTTSRHRIVFMGDKLPLVLADVERLGQVLDNLISNAVKYTPKGGELMVRSEHRGARVRVSICDSGVGIPKGEQGKIFDRFYRVKGASAGTVSGIGLGLYICREIIEKHGGQIAVESVPDEGSTFYFELPIYTFPENHL